MSGGLEHGTGERIDSIGSGAGRPRTGKGVIQAMAYKNLLVHVDDTKACESRIAAAIAVARTHGAHLTGLYVAADPALPGGMRAEVPADFLRTLQEHLEERMAAGKAKFDKIVSRAGLTADSRAVHCAATMVADTIALHGRYADLIVLGQPDSDDHDEMQVADAEDVVMGAGRPCLVVPYIGAGKTIGEHTMVAWDARREAARAVGDAMPILERAKSVVVMTVNPKRGIHGDEPGADISLHLARHGIKVEAQHIEARDLSVADVLLSRMADEDIDLLVMGAYGHSRFREWVMGGVTRQIFANMTVPVLMSH